MQDLNYILPQTMQLTETQALLKAGETFLVKQKQGDLSIDFKACQYLNSLALGVIIKLNNLYRQKKRRLFLKNVPVEILETLRSTSLDKVLLIETSDTNRCIDTANAAVSLSIQMDFEFYREVGIFHFSGSMLTPQDADLFYNMARRILLEGHKMLIDMSDLVYIDSMGIGAIIRIYQIMKEHKGEIRICGAGDILKELLDRQNLTSLIKVYNTADKALDGWL
ncbi:MAG: STAS domain-containing protein [Fibrobacterota bacterium]